MATLSAVTTARDGAVAAGAAAEAGGDEFANTGKELLVIENTGVSSVTLTVEVNKTLDNDDLTVPDREVTIGAGERHVLGPWPTGLYNDGDDKVQLCCSVVTDIEVAVVLPGS